MAHSAEFQFEDGTPVRFLLTPGPAPVTAPADPAGPYPGPYGPEEDDELPPGMGPAVPVARGDRDRGEPGRFAAYAGGALRSALRPVGALLEEVHHTVTSVPQPPSEVSITFGAQIGQDLKLGIVGGTGQAHLTVTAVWQPVPAAPAADPGTGTGTAPGTDSTSGTGAAAGPE
ncbi:CU044_2847 family protein [Streptomyces tsukubensis]|uniref:CU044_2847 family protein n=1 Tax=Streptomyces tsukubensis TaxID=83656 RepID=UPI003683750B